MYKKNGLKNNYDKMVVYPLAGDRFSGDLSRFVELGITIDYSCNVKFMQVPIAGSAEFVREWVASKMGIIKKILQGVSGLSHRQVALYLLRKAGHGCRVLYYLRTCPRDLIAEFVDEFDDNLRSTFESVVSLATSEGQWEQAGFKVKQSGLGLTRAGDIADVAYLASRDATFDGCVALDRGHVWDDGTARGDEGVAVIGEWLAACVSRVNERLHELSRFGFGRHLGIVKQGLLMEVVQKRRQAEIVAGAGLVSS